MAATDKGVGFDGVVPMERVPLDAAWLARTVVAIRAAVDEEREACAAQLEAAARRWPDEPQVVRVLLGEAEDIRARGKG